MALKAAIHKGVVRPGLLRELESFRAGHQRISSYYLDLDPQRWGSSEAIRIAVKNFMNREAERIAQLDVRPAVRQNLRSDWEIAAELAFNEAGDRNTRAIACFVASDARYVRAFRLPWPVRPRAFFEDRFVLWPLQQILDLADRYAVCLTDKDDARIFLVQMSQIEEVTSVLDEIPGKVRFPDPFGELEYQRKHIEHFHHHFDRVAETLLRFYQQEPFEHLILGGLWETLPQFESRLHRYLRDRVVARWDLDVHTPAPQILERALEEERALLKRRAEETWRSIQDLRPQRGAVGPEEVFAALWQRRVQTLLVAPNAELPGSRCPNCGRLQRPGSACVECGAATTCVENALTEAVHEAVEQGAQVVFCEDPALGEAERIAALRRY